MIIFQKQFVSLLLLLIAIQEKPNQKTLRRLRLLHYAPHVQDF